MLFDKFLGSFVFHVLVNHEVYRVTCPSEGHTGDRDGVEFAFRFDSSKDISQVIRVFASGTLLASDQWRDGPVVLLRAAKTAVELGETTFGLSTGNFDTFSQDSFAGKSNEQLRFDISKYLLDRYEYLFEPPFTVVEAVTCIQWTSERIVRALHYLHKHEMVSFNWAPEVWKEKTEFHEWLIEQFTISKANHDNLQAATKQRIISPISKNLPLRESKWDFFICHASEDKSEVAEPLAAELNKRGVQVWYDLWTLTLGDSLSRKIDEGLVNSRFGIVVLSPHFFAKHWPQKELSGFSQKEVNGRKVILPVWHKVDRDYVASHSLTLADRIAVSTNSGIDHVASEILKAADLDPNNDKEKSSIGKQSHVADVSIGWARVEIQTHLHVYNLVVKVKLEVPPDQGRLRFKFTWPAIVPIVETSNLKVNNRTIEGGIIQASEYTIDWEERVFPGEAVELVGPHSKHRLRYKFDHSVWSEVEKHSYYLNYSLYFEDHPPINGSVPFKELNEF